MNKFVQAAIRQAQPTARTFNGAPTNVTTYNRCLDLFAVVGSHIPGVNQTVELFRAAYTENPDLAVRIMLWSRDCRGGAGRKDNLMRVIDYLSKSDPELVVRILQRLPELGYWKDVFTCYTLPIREVQKHILYMIKQALFNNDALCAKWFPRKGVLFNDTATHLGWSYRKLRKTVVSLTTVVETTMSNREWEGINYSQVPSKAGIIYRNAFKRHDEGRYSKWQDDVAAGKTKMNTAQLLPHDIVGRIDHTRFAYQTKDRTLINAWDNLPAYYDPRDNTTLPVIDVSGSMDQSVGNTTAMDISIALGIYSAQRNTGYFKDITVKFTTTPRFVAINNLDIYEAVEAVKQSPIGMSTNLIGVFELILNTAIKERVPQHEMPNSILIISDLEFDRPNHLGADKTNFQHIKDMYTNAGYKKPKIIYWNVVGRTGNNPVTRDDEDVALISGYSPSILKSVLGREWISPTQAMLDTILTERYRY